MTMKIFCNPNDPMKERLYKVVIGGEVDKMLDILTKRDYSLVIADIPYGFNMAGSTNDEKAFT